MIFCMTRNFILLIVLSIPFTSIGYFYFNINGLDIPMIFKISQILSFVYLLFLPGFLALNILDVKRLSFVEFCLYSVGISISLCMFLGFSINLIYPLLGFYSPISPISLYISITIVNIVLCFFYKPDRNSCSISCIINKYYKLKLQMILLFVITITSVVGTYFVNDYNSNRVLLIYISLVCLVTLFIGFNTFFQQEVYPFAIYLIGLSLIWHNTLITEFINVRDVISEYQASHFVIMNSFWDWSSFGNYNSVLSIVILAPIFCNFLNIELNSVFKILYPIIFALMPVGAFHVYYNMTQNRKLSMLSCLFMIYISPFYIDVATINKQAIAEFFFVLILMLIFSCSIYGAKKSALIIVFSASLIVSHYGISYMIIILLFFLIIFNYQFNIDQLMAHKHTSIYHFIRIKTNTNICLNVNKNLSANISFPDLYFVLFYLVAAIIWYMYVSSSSVFDHAIHRVDFALTSIVDELFSSKDSRGAFMITKDSPSSLHLVPKLFHILTQLLIILGFVHTLIFCVNKKPARLYLGISLFFIMMLVIALAHTGFSAMDPRRLYQLSLIVLAPFCIIGFVVVYNYFPKQQNKSLNDSLLKAFSIFLAIYLLFNTGFIYEVTKIHPTSASLSQDTIYKFGDINDKANLCGTYIMSYDVLSGKWLGKYKKDHEIVWRGDWKQDYPSLTIYGGIDSQMIKSFDNTTSTIDNGYIQLSYTNLYYGVGSNWYNWLQKRTAYSFNEVTPLLEHTNTIYDNGGSKLLVSNVIMLLSISSRI